MTFAEQLTAIESAVQTVCAALSPALTDVCLGMPVPRGRCVRIYWDGESQAAMMPGRYSLTSELIADHVIVRGFWPIGSADEAAHAGRVAEMAALAHGVRTALDVDRTLAVEVQYAEPDLVQIGGALFAIVDLPLILPHREVEMS